MLVSVALCCCTCNAEGIFWRHLFSCCGWNVSRFHDPLVAWHQWVKLLASRYCNLSSGSIGSHTRKITTPWNNERASHDKLNPHHQIAQKYPPKSSTDLYGVHSAMVTHVQHENHITGSSEARLSQRDADLNWNELYEGHALPYPLNQTSSFILR